MSANVEVQGWVEGQLYPQNMSGIHPQIEDSVQLEKSDFYLLRAWKCMCIKQ